MAQAERIVKSKKRLPKGLLAFATAPLHKANFKADVIHGLSDVLQAYHLGNDWSAAHDIFPFEMTMTMNSSACHGVAAVYLTKKPNITPMCSGSYTAGKTEQGEINWIWPGDQLAHGPVDAPADRAGRRRVLPPDRRDLSGIQYVQALSVSRLDKTEGVTGVEGASLARSAKDRRVKDKCQAARPDPQVPWSNSTVRVRPQ
jgi:hypothetical protein